MAKKALPEKEGLKLWESRRRDWHMSPGHNKRRQKWYNPVHCVEAIVSMNDTGDVVAVKVYPSV